MLFSISKGKTCKNLDLKRNWHSCSGKWDIFRDQKHVLHMWAVYYTPNVLGKHGPFSSTVLILGILALKKKQHLKKHWRRRKQNPLGWQIWPEVFCMKRSKLDSKVWQFQDEYSLTLHLKGDTSATPRKDCNLGEKLSLNSWITDTWHGMGWNGP